MRLLHYFVSLRSEIIEIISGVDNAKSFFSWDDTKPNYSIKSDLEQLFQKHIRRVEEFGFYIVLRHTPCGKIEHHKHPDGEYVVENIGEKQIAFRDPSFDWQEQLAGIFQDIPCPCTDSTQSLPHHVCYELAFSKSADKKSCQAMEKIFEDLIIAIENSADKKPRSGIRELLLRIVLKLNDEILGETMDSRISKLLNGSKY